MALPGARRKLNPIVVLFTFIIGMSVGILSGFGIPFWYFVIIVVLFCFVAFMSMVSTTMNRLGEVGQSLLTHGAIVLGGIIFVYLLWTLRQLEPVFKVLISIFAGG